MIKLIAIKNDNYIVFDTIKMRFYDVAKSEVSKITELENELNRNKYNKFTASYTVQEGKLLLTVVGKRLGKYLVATSDKRIMFMSDDELLRYIRKVKFSNASYTILREGARNESIMIVSTFESFKDISNEIIECYDKYDILKIKDEYTKLKCEHNGESDCYSNGNVVALSFGGFKEVKMKGDVTANFITYYRGIWSKIVNDTMFVIYRIYNKYVIEDGVVRADGEQIGYYIKWKDGAEVYVPRADKRMCKLVELKGKGQFSKKVLYGIISMYSYGSSEVTGTDSVITAQEKCDELNMGTMLLINSLVNQGLNGEMSINDSGELVINGNSIKMKYRARIDARDNKTLETRCAGEIRASRAKEMINKRASK